MRSSHCATAGSRRMTKDDDRAADFSREKYLALLRAGLWPATALAYLGVSSADWRKLRAADAALAAETAQAVAAFELIHVRNLHTKIQEANDWRGSAWWLAQRFPRRYGTGRANLEAAKAVESVVQAIDDSLRAEFTTPAELERVGKVL